jgi:hypothetical protein
VSSHIKTLMMEMDSVAPLVVVVVVHLKRLMQL